MNQLEIFERIQANNRLIQELFKPNTFVLNNMIADLLNENSELQKHCRHEYVDHYCIYCLKEEPQPDD